MFRRFLITLLLITVSRGAAADTVYSVEAFLKRKAMWRNLVGATIAVEGRVQFMDQKRVRFLNCEFPFTIDDGVKNQLGNEVRVVEVTGQLEVAAEGKLFFKVIRLDKRPTDEGNLAVKRGAIDTLKPANWYEVAEWASERGTFYNDRKLLDATIQLREEGIRTEVRQTVSTDFRRMRELSAKAKQFALPDRFCVEIAQEAYRREYDRLWDDQRFRKKKSDYSALIVDIQRGLPGAEDPLTADDEDLRQKYLAHPEDTYKKADDDTRHRLHRDLYARVLLASILTDEADDGRNGYALAERIDQQLPEYKAEAEELREKELKFQFTKLGTMTKTDLAALSTRYAERKQPQRIETAKRKWLELREPRLREVDGSRGLVEMGDDYQSLLQETDRALQLFIEANRMSPEAPEPLERLTKLGYIREGGRWISKDSHIPAPTIPRSRMVEEGVVRSGMTSKEVLAALGGPPAAIARFAAVGKIQELWYYDGARFTIQLTKTLPKGELRVTGRSAIK